MIAPQKLLAGAAVIAAAAIVLWPAFRQAALPMDEGLLLVCPELLQKGQLPYRDFHLTKGPGNIVILSAAYAISKPNIFVERAVGLAYRLLLLLAIFGIALRWNTLVALGCALIGLVLLAGTAGLVAHTWIAALAFALCSVWMMAKSDSAWRCFVAGALAGIAVSCRLDLIVALTLASLPLIPAMNHKTKRIFFAGAALTLLPLVALFVVAGPANAWANLIAFPIFNLFPGRRLPIASAERSTLWLLGLALMAIATGAVAGILGVRKKSHDARSRLLLSIALFALGLMHYAIQRFDSIHVLLVALVPFALAPIAILSFLTQSETRAPAWWMSIVAVALPLAAIQFTAPAFTRSFCDNLRTGFGFTPPTNASFIERNGRTFPFATKDRADAAARMLSELERVSTSGQRLFVGPADLRQTNYCDTFIYHLLPQLKPATYFLEMNPGVVDKFGSRLARDVESADWIVLNRQWDFMSESNRSGHLGSNEPNEIIQTRFDPWTEIGPYLLFRNRRLRNAIMRPPP